MSANWFSFSSLVKDGAFLRNVSVAVAVCGLAEAIGAGYFSLSKIAVDEIAKVTIAERPPTASAITVPISEIMDLSKEKIARGVVFSGYIGKLGSICGDASSWKGDPKANAMVIVPSSEGLSLASTASNLESLCKVVVKKGDDANLFVASDRPLTDANPSEVFFAIDKKLK